MLCYSNRSVSNRVRLFFAILIGCQPVFAGGHNSLEDRAASRGHDDYAVRSILCYALDPGDVLLSGRSQANGEIKKTGDVLLALARYAQHFGSVIHRFLDYELNSLTLSQVKAYLFHQGEQDNLRTELLSACGEDNRLFSDWLGGQLVAGDQNDESRLATLCTLLQVPTLGEAAGYFQASLKSFVQAFVQPYQRCQQSSRLCELLVHAIRLRLHSLFLVADITPTVSSAAPGVINWTRDRLLSCAGNFMVNSSRLGGFGLACLSPLLAALPGSEAFDICYSLYQKSCFDPTVNPACEFTRCGHSEGLVSGEAAAYWLGRDDLPGCLGVRVPPATNNSAGCHIIVGASNSHVLHYISVHDKKSELTNIQL